MNGIDAPSDASSSDMAAASALAPQSSHASFIDSFGATFTLLACTIAGYQIF